MVDRLQRPANVRRFFTVVGIVKEPAHGECSSKVKMRSAAIAGGRISPIKWHSP
jgi:hypothetical protein